MYHSKSMFKKTLIIMVIMVVFIAVVGGATYVALQQKSEKPQEEQGEQEEATTTEVIDTSDWKTYKNLSMGFSMKYPPSWVVISEHPYLGGKRVAFQFANVEFTVIRGATLYSEVKGRDLAFEEIVDTERRLAQKYIDPKEKEILLDGHSAIAVSYTQYWERAEEYISITHIYEKSENVWLYLAIYKYNDVQRDTYEPIFDQMLSTFRFIK